MRELWDSDLQTTDKVKARIITTDEYEDEDSDLPIEELGHEDEDFIDIESEVDEVEDTEPIEEDIPDDIIVEIPLDKPIEDIEPEVLEELEKNNEDVVRILSKDDLSEFDREEMINELAAKNIKMVYYVVNKFSSNAVTQDDLISAGMLGYAKALKKFNPDRGVKLSTFAINCIINEIRFCLRKENKHFEKHISMNVVKYEDKNGSQVTLEDSIADKKLTPEQEQEKNALKDIIGSIVNTLSPIEKYIITYRFGLDREIELTQKEIADQVDMSQANVSKIERGCMDKIKELYLNSLSR